MSLLLNMLSRLVIAFLPRSKCLLISWLQSPFAEILISTHNLDSVLQILLFLDFSEASYIFQAIFHNYPIYFTPKQVI